MLTREGPIKTREKEVDCMQWAKKARKLIRREEETALPCQS